MGTAHVRGVGVGESRQLCRRPVGVWNVRQKRIKGKRGGDRSAGNFSFLNNQKLNHKKEERREFQHRSSDP